MATAKRPRTKPATEPPPAGAPRPRSYAQARRAAARRAATDAAAPPTIETIEAKVIAIGNSRGIRLPRAVLTRYAIGDAVLLEVREGGLLLRGKNDERLSWDDTYKDMARARETWSDLDVAVGDGLDKEPW
jgi:antitoxin MazE